MKIGYVFTYGVDGFGADVAPAHEEGVYLDYDKAFNHLVELNSNVENPYTFYEAGYGLDYYPEEDETLTKLEAEEDWEAFDVELEKHKIKGIRAICERIMQNDTPPYGMYSMEQIEIHE